MENSDTDIDTTDGDGEINAGQEELNSAECEDEQSEEGSSVTDKKLERKLRELEAEVMLLRKEEMLLKKMVSGPITKQQVENKLKFYKFSGLYVSKCTHNKLRVDLTPTLYGKRPAYSSYYIQFRILSDTCFIVENTHLPSGLRERLYKKEVSVDELRSFLSYLRHICECTESKLRQFIEAEKDPGNACEDDGINVRHTIFIFDNLHVQVAFQPTGQKCLHMWLVVYLLYNDNEIFFEPQGIQVQSSGFSQEIQQRLKELFVDGHYQELKFTVYKAKNFISDVLQCMNELESSSEYTD